MIDIRDVLILVAEEAQILLQEPWNSDCNSAQEWAEWAFEKMPVLLLGLEELRLGRHYWLSWPELLKALAERLAEQLKEVRIHYLR